MGATSDSIVDLAAAYVTGLFREQLDERYTYHNIAHTHEVVEAARLIGSSSGLDDRDLGGADLLLAVDLVELLEVHLGELDGELGGADVRFDGGLRDDDVVFGGDVLGEGVFPDDLLQGSHSWIS